MAKIPNKAPAAPKDVLKLTTPRKRSAKSTDPLNFKNEDWYGSAWAKFAISRASQK